MGRAIKESRGGRPPQGGGKPRGLLLPPMSQETRLKMVGQTKGMAETAQVALRNARRDANKLAETEEKGGVLTEDKAKKAKDQIQDLIKKYEHKGDELIEHKRKVVMEGGCDER